jgi:hypothetical protein
MAVASLHVTDEPSKVVCFAVAQNADMCSE